MEAEQGEEAGSGAPGRSPFAQNPFYVHDRNPTQMRLSRKIHISSVYFLGSKGSNGAAVWSTVSLLPSLCSSFPMMLSSHASCEDSFCLSAWSNVELSGKSVSVRKCLDYVVLYVCRELS